MASAPARCSHCATPLPLTHTGPCPNCGQVGKTIVQQIDRTLHVHAAGEGIWERRLVARKLPWVRRGLIGLDVALFVGSTIVGGPLGVIAGLAMMGVNHFVTPRVIEKVVQRGHGTRELQEDEEERITRRRFRF